MARVTVNYKDRTLISMTSSGTKTLLTNDKYCEDNFQITYTGPSLHSKTVTPTESAQYIYPSSSYDGLSQVVVNGISSNYVGTGINRRNSTNTTFSSTTGTFTAPAGYYSSVATKTITTQAAQTITPTTTSQYISSYRWLTGSQTIAPIPSAYIIPSGTKTITSNNTYDVYSYSSVYVNTPVPSGTLNITSNGIYNVYGYSSASVTVDTKPEYYGIYKAIADGHTLYSVGDNSYSYTSEEITSWADSLTTTSYNQFAGVHLQGSFNFSNISLINRHAFAFPYANTIWGRTVSCYLNFPKVTYISGAGFAENPDLKTIEASLCTNIDNYAFYSCMSLNTANFLACNSIGVSAFYYCSRLRTVSFPNLTHVGSYAFYSCYSLVEANFSNCTSINDYAFAYCSSLTSINFPKCSYISDNAFYNCKQLVEANFPSCISIGSSAFAYCFSLISINFPLLGIINSTTFAGCSSLINLSLPQVSFINFAGFRSCINLQSVNLSQLLSLSGQAFSGCSGLQTIKLSNCSIVFSSAFYNCKSLTTVSIPVCTSFGAYAFSGCWNLISLYLNQVSSIPTFGVGMFASTPISNYSTVAGRYGSIFVPSSLYTAFTTATSWSAYSARMVSV